MPGTVSDLCNFSNCRYRSVNDNVDVQIQYNPQVDSVLVDDKTKWWLEIQTGQDHFTICDLQPLP